MKLTRINWPARSMCTKSPLHPSSSAPCSCSSCSSCSSSSSSCSCSSSLLLQSPPSHSRSLEVAGLAGSGAHGVLAAAVDLHRAPCRQRLHRPPPSERRLVHRRASQSVVGGLHRVAARAGHGRGGAGAVGAEARRHHAAVEAAGQAARARPCARRAAHSKAPPNIRERSQAREGAGSGHTGCRPTRGGCRAGSWRAARSAAACPCPGPARGAAFPSSLSVSAWRESRGERASVRAGARGG